MTSNSALPPQDKEMTLVQHLLELRNTMTKAILAVIVMFIVLFPFANDLYVYVAEPLNRFMPEGASMIATGVASPFLTPFKLSLVLAIYLSMPYLLYQLWTFIAPALYTHERKLVGPILFFSSFLFYAGGAFAFYVVFPLVFGFLSTAAPEGVTIATDISLYLDFVIKMFFAFGFAFEVPIVVVLLILTGMVSPDKMSHARPYVVVGAFVIGMLLTPPDIISQTLLAVPMWLLYEAGIIVGRWVLKGRKQKSDSSEAPQVSPDNKNNHSDDVATSTAASSTNESPQTSQDFEFDDRYADQLDDDTDWDAAFEQIDSEFADLDREYQKKKKGDLSTDADPEKNRSEKTPLESKEQTHLPDPSVETDDSSNGDNKPPKA